MKKNIFKIPPLVRAKLNKIQEQYIVAACSRVYSLQELESGILSHLGIQFSESMLVCPEVVLPPPESGKYSNRNINGYEVIRRDLPKETHYNAIESPNWGDSYNGTHTVNLPYEMYPRDYHGPSLFRIKIQKISSKADKGKLFLIFQVDRVLDRKNKNFNEALLEDLNLLQENVGMCGVQKSDASISDYIRGISVSWEVLPPGTKDEVVARLFSKRGPSPEEKKIIEERYDFLMGLNPAKLIFGTSGFERYFGALLNDNLVIFENVSYGNAVYIMFNDWKKLSQRTRLELLSGRYGKDFERVPHSSGWKGKIKIIIAEHQVLSKT